METLGKIIGVIAGIIVVLGAFALQCAIFVIGVVITWFVGWTVIAFFIRLFS